MAAHKIASDSGIFNVYYIECATTGLGYVGITSWSISRRFARHLQNARTGRPGTLYAAMREHGPDAFKASFLQTVPSWQEACEVECALIAELRTKIPEGYNTTNGGDGNRGYEYTDEVRKRMSASGKAKRLSEEHKRKIGENWKGRKHSPESLVKIAAARKGKKASTETREKMRAARLGRKFPTVSAAMTGKKHTQEWIEHIRAGMIGIKRSEEAKANMRIAAAKRVAKLKAEGRFKPPPNPSGTHHTLEMRQKIGQKRKAAWDRLRQGTDVVTE